MGSVWHRAAVAGLLLWVAAPRAVAEHPKDSRPVLVLLLVRGGNAFSAEDLGAIEDLLLSALDRTGRFRVIGRSDIQSMLDLEARKQASGCDDTGCMTQIAGALGADYVATAGVGRLGSTRVLTLKVINAHSAFGLVHARETVQSDDDLVRAVDSVAEQTAEAYGREPGALPGTATQPRPATRPASKPLPPEVFIAPPAKAALSAEVLRPVPARPLKTPQIWGIVALSGAAVIAGGSVAFDNLAPTSRDHRFEPVDVLPVVGYAVALVLAGVGIYEVVPR